MREIKFRAWHSDNEEMVVFKAKVLARDSFQAAHLMNLMAENSKYLMQFTGLKDKNGKEIYEGDVVDEKYKWEVVFSNGAFWATRDGSRTGLLYEIINKRNTAGVPLEIIGNIHENQELLNGINK